MQIILRQIAIAILIISTSLLSACGGSNNAVTGTNSGNQSQVTEVATTTGKVKFKLDGGADAFELKFKSDGAKLVDSNDTEIARIKIDASNKVKVKDAADKTLGYVVPEGGYWKVKDASQQQELYVLRRQSDGDYKLENGQDQEIYRVKARDYGFEIETPAKKSLYKVKSKNGKISLRNAADDTVLYTKSSFKPIAVACFGFDVLNREQQVALAYAVNEIN